MRLVNVREVRDLDEKYIYAVKFNNADRKVIRHFSDFADLLAQLRLKKFDVKTGEWIITQSGYDSFLNLDEQIFSRENLPAVTISEVEKKNITDYAEMGKNLKLSLYDYQKQLIKFSLDAQNALIVAPCGAGKTPVCLGIYDEARRRKIISGCGLIVVKASLKTQWLMEVKKFTNFRAKIVQSSSIFRNAPKKFNAQFKDADLLILNYETLRDKNVRKVLHKIKPQCVFADECHYIKNFNSKRARALYEFSYAKIKIGATATPVQKDPRDIFGLFSFINPEIFPYLPDFNRTFVKFVGKGIVGGAKNEDLLNKKISPFMIVKTKSEISAQLPKLVVTQRHCELEPRQVRMTEDLKFELSELTQKKLQLEKNLSESELSASEEYKKIDAEIMARQNFAQELADSEKLLSMSDSTMAKNYLTGSKRDNKLDLLMDLIEEVVESGEKMTIFSRFAKMQEIIIERIKLLATKNPAFDFEIARVFGAMTEKNRYSEVYEKFQNNDRYKILLMSDAGAEGFNLSKCKYLCEYEPAISFAVQTQRHGRIERADSIFDNVIVYQLIANDSWDEIAQKIVSKKERYDSAIIKGKV